MKKTSIKPLSHTSIKLGSSIKSFGKSKEEKFDVGTIFKTDKGVHLSQKDRQNHTHIIGSTGTGKSKFIELLLRQDIKNKNCGLCLIDPHGNLYDEIVLYIAEHCPYLADRLILFNPAHDTDNVVGFNPIPSGIDDSDYVIDMLISACLKAWGQDNTDKTPRITKWLENIFYTIIANDLTLVESAPLLSLYANKQRNILLSKVSNLTILDDWQMFEQSTQTQKQTLIEGAANRLRKLLRNKIIRNIIGQKERVLDFSSIMKEGKVVLVNLAGGVKISNDNAKLLGIMLVNEIFRCAKLRDPLDPSLKPFYFYIDEFGQFVTRDIARAIEECRKFKLFLILAHQHLAQLKKEDEYLYASVLTNCKNKVIFGGLSFEDTETMMNEISTGFLHLKEIKDVIHSTKVRHIEEKREVIAESMSETQGTSNAVSETWSESHGESEGETHTTGKSITDTEGKTNTSGKTKNTGKSTAKGTIQGYSDGYNETEGESFSTSRSETDSLSHTDNESQSRILSRSKSQSHAISESEGISRNETDNLAYTESASESYNQSFSTSQAHSVSESEGISRNETKSIAHTDSESESQSKSLSKLHSRTDSKSEGTSTSETDSHSHTSSQSSSEGSSQMSAHGKSESTGKSTNYGTSDNWRNEISRNLGDSTSSSDSSSKGSSESHTSGASDTTGKSSSKGKSFTTGRSDTEAYGESIGKTKTIGTSKTEGHSLSEGENFTKGRSITEGYSESAGESASTGISQTEGYSLSEGENFTKGRSETEGYSESEGESASTGSSDTKGRSVSIGNSEGKNRSKGISHTDNVSESIAETDSIGNSSSHSVSDSQSRGIGTQESTSTSQNRTITQGEAHGITETESHSTTKGITKSKVPFLRPQEYQELTSRTFWSLEELKHMQIGDIKNQDVGEAFIKVGANKPIKTQIAFVKPTYYSSRFTPKKIEHLKMKVLKANSQYYTPIDAVQEEYHKRHDAIFGEPLRFDEEPPKPLAAAVHDTSDVIDIEANAVEDPFES